MKTQNTAQQRKILSHVTAAYTLGLTLSNSSKSEDITIPVESTAGYVAGLINEKAKTLGVEASATTRVKLSAPNYDGTISFTLESKTGIPLSKTILCGFSQGGAMTMDVGVTLPLAGLIILLRNKKIN